MVNRDLCGTMPENPILAYAYVPMQKWGEMYTPAEGLTRGTMFPAIDKPLGVYGRDLCKKCDDGEVACCDIF